MNSTFEQKIHAITSYEEAKTLILKYEEYLNERKNEEGKIVEYICDGHICCIKVFTPVEKLIKDFSIKINNHLEK